MNAGSDSRTIAYIRCAPWMWTVCMCTMFEICALFRFNELQIVSFCANHMLDALNYIHSLGSLHTIAHAVHVPLHFLLNHCLSPSRAASHNHIFGIGSEICMFMRVPLIFGISMVLMLMCSSPFCHITSHHPLLLSLCPHFLPTNLHAFTFRLCHSRRPPFPATMPSAF